MKLVSIVSPVFNGESYIHRFLDSILKQSYSNIELILVDDGSTDNTKKIIEEYKPKFNLQKINLKYIYQENGGAASAVNNGFKHINGDYVMWPDSDDTLVENALTEMVEYLGNNQEIHIVNCQIDYVDEEFNVLSTYKRIDKNKSYFNDLLYQKNISFGGGSYLVKSDEIQKIMDNGGLFESQGGQNYQILLPTTYFNKIGYIDKPLFQMYVRPSSHSRSDNTLEKEIKKTYLHEEIILKTLERNHILLSENELFKLKRKYQLKRFKASLKHNEKVEKYYKEIKEKGINEFLLYIASKLELINLFFIIKNKGEKI